MALVLQSLLRSDIKKKTHTGKQQQQQTDKLDFSK